MNLVDWRESLIEEVQGIIAPGFEHIITRTRDVPSIEGDGITYPNLTDRTQRSKLLESTVLFADLRGSTQISMRHGQETLAAMYSAYVRAMTRCGTVFEGHVRNIIGDRVMVVFDRKDCFLHAVNTAILMNSVMQFVLNPMFPHDELRCGIGIDFGEMLVTKTGVIRQGTENSPNKSLVWLGKPANIASKLTDIANKSPNTGGHLVGEGYYYPNINEWGWSYVSVAEFIDNLDVSLGNVTHRKDYFHSLIKRAAVTELPRRPPILMTEAVLDGLKAEAPHEQSLANNWWSEKYVSIAGYDGNVQGGDVYYEVFRR